MPHIGAPPFFFFFKKNTYSQTQKPIRMVGEHGGESGISKGLDFEEAHKQ